MSKNQIRHFEDLNASEIFFNYILTKHSLFSATFSKAAGKSSALLGPLGAFALVDPTGFSAVATALMLAGGAMVGITGAGVSADIYRLKKQQKTVIQMKNFAGQNVVGKAQDVIALVALQEEILKICENEKDMSHYELDSNLKRKENIRHKMMKIRKEVSCHGHVPYKILMSGNEVEKLGLEDQVRSLKTISRTDYARLYKNKPRKP